MPAQPSGTAPAGRDPAFGKEAPRSSASLRTVNRAETALETLFRPPEPMQSVPIPAVSYSQPLSSVRPRGSISSGDHVAGIHGAMTKAAEASLYGSRDLDEAPPPYYVDPGVPANKGSTVRASSVGAGVSPTAISGASPLKDASGGLVNINISLTQNHFNLGLPQTPAVSVNDEDSRPSAAQSSVVPMNRTVFSSFPTSSSTTSSSIVFSTALPMLLSSETLRFLGLCFLWYSSSALTNNIGKSILNLYSFPVTLTIVQFLLTGLLTYIFGHGLGFTRIRPPTREILFTTAPLSMFQIVGHVLSSVAITYVPVSFAHTIKALSPLFTVIIYRVFFNVPYSRRVYSSIFLVTGGVMLVITNKVVYNHIGFFTSLGSCIIFVVQNIFSKKLFSAARAAAAAGSHWHGGHHKTNPAKLDKLNLLFYSATTAFVLMIPMWVYSEGLLSSPSLPAVATKLGVADGKAAEAAATPSSLMHGGAAANGWYFPGLYVSWLFLLNGLSYFAQNVLAFTLLSLVSPVTYSVASLVKRIFVIVAAMVWFADTVSWIQAVGILVTFAGLWMYQGAKGDVARGEAKLEMDDAAAIAAEEGGANGRLGALGAGMGKRSDIWAAGHVSPKPHETNNASEGSVVTPLLSSRTMKGSGLGSLGSMGSALGE